MTNTRNEVAEQAKGKDIRARMKPKPLEAQQTTTETLPAQGDQFHITFPNDPDIDDDQQLKMWLHKAHSATETMRERIGAVLKAKRDRLHSQGKASGGGWQQWVEDNCDFTPRTANRYIKAYDTGDKGLPPEGTKDEKPIQARVEFSDNELGSKYKKAKKVNKVNRMLNQKFEQAAREVIEELQSEADAQGIDFEERLHNKGNEKDEEDLKDVTSDSGQSQE